MEEAGRPCTPGQLAEGGVGVGKPGGKEALRVGILRAQWYARSDFTQSSNQTWGAGYLVGRYTSSSPTGYGYRFRAA